MKGQGTRLSRRLSEDMNISGEVVAVVPSHSHSFEEAQNNAHPYVQLRDVSKKRKSHLTAALDILTALGIREEALSIGQPLTELLAKEMSCSRHFRWAAVDNLVEKILQGLLLNKQDISKKAIGFFSGMIRQTPSGRSLLLYHTSGLRKIYAARGLVLTTEMVLNEAVKIFIYASLSYRLYESLATGSSNFLEFTEIFGNNSQKGVSSLVRLLANFDPEWLYLLLTSPAIAGVLKGLWDTRKSQLLTENAINHLKKAVNRHVNANALLTKSYLWGDVLRQMIPMPGFSSVSERVQKAEQQIRWDGRISNEERNEERLELFKNIETLALKGSGMSKINAMQSLAKIVHSLSIKDFPTLRQAGYSQETLIQILSIKTQALRDLKMLSNRARVQPVEEAQQNSAATPQHSLMSAVYAIYLLWWLGMGQFKYSPLFWSFKLGKLALEGLFLKVVVESILEVINCPDKKGFRMFFGDYEIWANQLTPDCFNEFVRQFRSIYKKEPLKPFLEQLNNFDLRKVESINLIDKALTSNETIEILNILNERASIKELNLGFNEINDTRELVFPNSLQFLDLSWNNLGDEGTKGLQLPLSLQTLFLAVNNIKDEGVKGLRLLSMIQTLDLANNYIGDEGAKGLQLPSSLTTLGLVGNNIGDEGAKAIHLRSLSSLKSLGLAANNIGDEGAQGLQFPSSLTTLSLGGNISAEGIKKLQLPASLTDLGLNFDNLGPEGVKRLELPSFLKGLSLSRNYIGAEGAKELRLPLMLEFLDLRFNNISIEGAKELRLHSTLKRLVLDGNVLGDEGANKLQLPSMLQDLYLGYNNIGDKGVKELKFPPMLIYLNLSRNNISDEGAKGLQLPPMLQSLELWENNIGDEGAKGLQLPPMLQYLDLRYNNIGDEGVNELLKKIPKTKLMRIDLSGNPYNSTAINPNRIIQQQRLLENCQDQLCHANTPLSAQNEYQTSGATRAQPPLFFSWLKKPFDKLAEYTSDCISETLSSLGARLEKAVSQSPSYFPNIRSSEINDWQPSGSVMLHQFKTGGSNVLLLSAPQTSAHLSLRSIAR